MSVRFDFSGTTTVITGGSSGIGLCCAEFIARCGGHVVISSSRHPEKTHQAAQRINQAAADAASSALAPPLSISKSNAKVMIFECDVGNEESVRSFFAQIVERLDPADMQIDYVIHCAGVSPNTDFFNQTQQEWDEVLHTNSTGAFLVTKYAALAMKDNPLQSVRRSTAGNRIMQQGQETSINHDFRGKIVLITSTNGINSQDPISAHYDSSKAAVNMLVRTGAECLSTNHQISLNGLAPGWINTELNSTLPDDIRQKESTKIWTGRWAEPEEMAECVAHILTMPYLLGQVIMVDGGYR